MGTMKFEVGDRVREINGPYAGVIEAISFNGVYQVYEYVVRWDDGGLSSYEEASGDTLLALDNVTIQLPPGVSGYSHTFHRGHPDPDGAKRNLDSMASMFGVPMDAPPSEASKQGCQHKWVEVGFMHTKTVCYHCDQEKR